MGIPAAVIDLDTVFANVPSRTEVEKAISALQRCLPSVYRLVEEAFHLLKTDFRKVVLSIVSDKSVWNAVLSNKTVQELIGSLKQARISAEELDWATTILRWIFKITMAIFGDIMARLRLLIDETFQKAIVGNLSSEVVKNFGRSLKTSLLLSVMIFFIVVVTGSQEVTPDK